MIGRAELTVRCKSDDRDSLHFVEPDRAGDMQVNAHFGSLEDADIPPIYLDEHNARQLFNWLGARLVKWPRT